jgi:hypothetical protein
MFNVKIMGIMRTRINKGHVAKATPDGELRIYSRKRVKPYVTVFGKTIAIKSGEEYKYKGLKICYK